MLKRFLFAVAAMAVCSTGVFAQDIFLSFGGDALTTSLTQDQSESTGSVELYARNGFNFAGADILFTGSNVDVASFTGGTGENPSLFGGTRFEVDPSVVIADGSEARFLGVAFTAFGVNGGFAAVDSTFRSGVDGFLLGTLEYELTGTGVAEFGLELGPNGFLGAPDPVFGGPVSLTVTSAVPEPSSAILLALGFAGFAVRRRR